MTLQRHHQITRDAMLKKMTNASAIEPVELTINGQAALQDEISGTQEGTNIVFLHTTVEGDKHFHQILAWTSKSRWDEHKEKLREVTELFAAKTDFPAARSHGRGDQHQIWAGIQGRSRAN